jgi:SOUL heme-binding protein
MKPFYIIAGVSLGIAVISQIYLVVSNNKTETQPYTVLRKEKDFEIRHYPSVTMATITSSAKSYRELGSSGFRKLAGFIFGGNSTKESIAMTTPVHMDIQDSASTMSFVMPSTYNPENLPQPNDGDVKIVTTAEEYVAAITFGGFASDDDIEKYTKKLEAALQAAGISYYGHFRFLGYNAPFQLIDRTNDIIVSVNNPAE